MVLTPPTPYNSSTICFGTFRFLKLSIEGCMCVTSNLNYRIDRFNVWMCVCAYIVIFTNIHTHKYTGDGERESGTKTKQKKNTSGQTKRGNDFSFQIK